MKEEIITQCITAPLEWPEAFMYTGISFAIVYVLHMMFKSM